MVMPVSPPPWDPPSPGTRATPIGLQRTAKWRAGDGGHEKQLIDCAQASPFLYRISVFGPVYVRITYGTLSNRHLGTSPQPLSPGTQLLLRTPLIATLPGQIGVYATPIDDGVDTIATCTVAHASGGALSQIRSVINSTGGAVAFEPDAVRYVALQASTLLISAIAVAVPALSSVPLVLGSSLQTGIGYQEFEP